MSDSRILLGILDCGYSEGLAGENLDSHGFDLATFESGDVLALKIDPDEGALRAAARALEAAGADPIILANPCPHLKALWLSRAPEDTTE